ncbi:MAG TPA: nitroreductase family protein [Pyrinomonadaceae bacterium]|jgi:nitroreductase
MSTTTETPVHDLILGRRSTLAFSGRAVSDEDLRSLLEAARWASSSYNEQPWHFIVATRDRPAEFERLLGCLVPGNAEWAGRAPVLMLSVAKLAFDRGGAANRHALHDVGQAAANLSIQASALGLSVHQMGGFDASKARAEFRIPEGFEPVAALAVGYPGDPEELPEALRAREQAPRTRRQLSEFVFAATWGQTAPVAA